MNHKQLFPKSSLYKSQMKLVVLISNLMQSSDTEFANNAIDSPTPF